MKPDVPRDGLGVQLVGAAWAPVGADVAVALTEAAAMASAAVIVPDDHAGPPEGSSQDAIERDIAAHHPPSDAREHELAG
ncbi:MAG: hypothetical protein E6J67_22955 [Deltaproteobacteria bacterium]|nr:MAG: hypothetical protein E6J67_22955 [Deltaproteobacteria bacterium]